MGFDEKLYSFSKNKKRSPKRLKIVYGMRSPYERNSSLQKGCEMRSLMNTLKFRLHLSGMFLLCLVEPRLAFFWREIRAEIAMKYGRA